MPGIAAGTRASAIAGNVDLAPTIADLGGAVLTDNPDGRSLVPLLKEPATAPSNWRQAYLLEHWVEVDTAQPPGGGAQLEPDEPDQTDSQEASNSSAPPTSIRHAAAGGANIPEFQGLRTATYTYVEYATGERELYDLTKDPYQLDNMAASASPALVTTLHQRLDSLRSCAGDTCRANESAPLSLPG